MTEVLENISDFEKYLTNTKKIVEEALDFSRSGKTRNT